MNGEPKSLLTKDSIVNLRLRENQIWRNKRTGRLVRLTRYSAGCNWVTYSYTPGNGWVSGKKATEFVHCFERVKHG